MFVHQVKLLNHFVLVSVHISINIDSFEHLLVLWSELVVRRRRCVFGHEAVWRSYLCFPPSWVLFFLTNAVWVGVCARVCGLGQWYWIPTVSAICLTLTRRLTVTPPAGREGQSGRVSIRPALVLNPVNCLQRRQPPADGSPVSSHHSPVIWLQDRSTSDL